MNAAWLVFGLFMAASGLLALTAVVAGRAMAPRGETTDAPDPTGPIDGAGEACALTGPPTPLEYVPPVPLPDLYEREREMADHPASLFADLLMNRSSR